MIALLCLLVLPLMLALELLLLLLTLVVGIIRPRWGLAMALYFMRKLPGRDWYWGWK